MKLSRDYMEAQIVVYLKRVKFSFEVLEKIMTNQIFLRCVIYVTLILCFCKANLDAV